jgi:adenylate cyclase
LFQDERRLAAIMFTDMVGYTALGQTDEPLSLALAAEAKKLLRPIFQRHNGREVKTMGDGFLVEFPSALEAVRCAYDVQRATREFNISLPSEKRVRLRVGVHLGDVVVSQGDISGDAVNVASRIEPLAEDGGVCLTRQVYDHVQNKFELRLASLGNKSLKNVSAPLEVYKMVMPWSEEKRMPSTTQRDKRRIAVLPFANISQDSKDEYFADGMTEELISTISNMSGLSVISRTSVMGYKGANKKIREIGQELEVGSVLEGSVRKAGNRMRVTVQLIDVESDKHLWAQSYDRELDDVFAVQGDIAKRVAEALRIKILPEEEKRIEKRPTKDIDAYAFYLKGRSQWNKRSDEGLRSAIDFFQKAIAIDHGYALAYSGIADSYAVLAINGHIPKTEGLPKAKRYATRALEIDDTLAEAHVSLAMVLEAHDWDWTRSEREFRRAIEINPSYATAHHWYALLLQLLGRFDEALKEIHRAQELDPLSMVINSAIIWVYNTAGEYDKAIEHGRRWLEMEPNSGFAHLHLASAYSRKKMHEEAIREARAAAADPAVPHWVHMEDLEYYYAQSGDLQEAQKLFAEILERSKTEYVSPSFFALHYLALGDEARMFEYLQRAYEERNMLIGLSRFDPDFAKYRQDPRYLDLLRKMKLEGASSSEETRRRD